MSQINVMQVNVSLEDLKCPDNSRVQLTQANDERDESEDTTMTLTNGGGEAMAEIDLVQRNSAPKSEPPRKAQSEKNSWSFLSSKTKWMYAFAALVAVIVVAVLASWENPYVYAVVLVMAALFGFAERVCNGAATDMNSESPGSGKKSADIAQAAGIVSYALGAPTVAYAVYNVLMSGV